ncbi:MAG: radical SAM protein [Chloroflexota bacterium]|nr:radical SAM protein [Chloroflexota bacterium]
MSIIYGPVSSWRLGRSLGIDLLNMKMKTCSFNCVYCQLGETTQVVTEPKQFVSLEQLGTELKAVRQIEADHATFSGMGEPTLASNLGEAIDMVKSVLDLPIAVLTNSSLMLREDVRGELDRADVVVAKLDAPNEELLATINKPAPGLHFDQIVDGIRRFRDEYKGNLALQIMFIEANKDYALEIATLVHEISPDEVQINTPLRPCGVKSLSPDDIAAIRQGFTDFENVVTVYETPKHEVIPLDLVETLRRRPKL